MTEKHSSRVPLPPRPSFCLILFLHSPDSLAPYRLSPNVCVQLGLGRLTLEKRNLAGLARDPYAGMDYHLQERSKAKCFWSKNTEVARRVSINVGEVLQTSGRQQSFGMWSNVEK